MFEKLKQKLDEKKDIIVCKKYSKRRFLTNVETHLVIWAKQKRDDVEVY